MTPTTTRNEPAFSRNTTPAPAEATSSPPSAGPTACARVTPALFSASAAGSSARPTISGVIAQNTGRPSAAPTPSARVRASTSPGVATSVSVTIASAAAVTTCHACVAMIMRRRSTMSASAPPGSASTKVGRAMAVCTRAISATEEVRVVISHPTATRCIHVPTYEASEAIHTARKTGIRSGLSADRAGSRADADVASAPPSGDGTGGEATPPRCTVAVGSQ